LQPQYAARAPAQARYAPQHAVLSSPHVGASTSPNVADDFLAGSEKAVRKEYDPGTVYGCRCVGSWVCVGV